MRGNQGTEGTILPLVAYSSNRDLIRSWIADQERYELLAEPNDVATAEFDCGIFDLRGLVDHEQALLSRKSRDEAVLPYLVLVPESRARLVRERLQDDHPELWERIDGILEIPIEEYRLEERIETMLRIREQSTDLLDQRQQLRRFKRASENAGHAIYITDINGKIEYVNPAFERITGYAAEDVLGETPRILKSGEMPDGYYEDLWEHVLSGNVWEEAVINRREDGELYHAHQTIAPITDDESVEAFVAIQTDVTRQKEREAELARYERIVENLPVGVYQTTPGPDGEFRLLNQATVELYEAESKAELRRHSPRDIFANPEERAEFSEKCLQHGYVENEELRLQTLSGERIWAEVTGVKARVDGEVVFDCAVKDVTERKDHEKRLRRYKQAVESSTEMLAAADTDQTFLFANEAYREFHGISHDEDLRTKSNLYVHGRERYEQIRPYIDRALNGESLSYEMERINANGETRTLDIHYSPIEDEGGEILGHVAAMRDVTEKRERTKQIRRLSEFRRVLSKVNQSLVRTKTIEEMLPRTADIIASSDFFECTFITIVDQAEPAFVCESESELTKAQVSDFHTEEYLDSVFAEGLLLMDDVTAPPYTQHVEDRPSHVGVAVAITHGDDQYGTLTVHFAPGMTPSDDEKNLLTGIADDIGFFLRSREIEDERRLFKEIAERIEDPVMLQDIDGRYRVVNQAVTEFANMDKADLIGKDESAFMSDRDVARIEKKKQQTIAEETTVNYQISPTLPTHPDRTFSTLRYPHYDSDGNLDGTVAIYRDITDLKERERQLTVFDRVLRHNLHNDMNVIEGYAQLIQARTTGVLETHAEKIIENSTKLLDTVSKERQITKFLSDPPRESTIDLVSIVRSIAEATREQHPEACVTTNLPEECFVRANEAIGQAVEELIENAITHIETEQSVVRLDLETDRETARLSVVDNGSGIPEMERRVLTGEAKIEPLYHGSGLGLWLVNLIVRQSDGSLNFSECEPRGSIVTIELHRPT